jgi:hypothetical protein
MITQERLKELLSYDPDTGVFIWKIRKGRCAAGTIAGRNLNTTRGKTYRIIVIDRRHYYAHWLAWMYAHGMFPAVEMDHINGNGSDNSISNLRPVTRSQNMKNTRLRKDNKSGMCGIYFCKRALKWKAQIGFNSRVTNLGEFSDKFEAICARKSAEHRCGFHSNHGEARPL